MPGRTNNKRAAAESADGDGDAKRARASREDAAAPNTTMSQQSHAAGSGAPKGSHMFTFSLPDRSKTNGGKAIDDELRSMLPGDSDVEDEDEEVKTYWRGRYYTGNEATKATHLKKLDDRFSKPILQVLNAKVYPEGRDPIKWPLRLFGHLVTLFSYADSVEDVNEALWAGVDERAHVSFMNDRPLTLWDVRYGIKYLKDEGRSGSEEEVSSGDEGDDEDEE